MSKSRTTTVALLVAIVVIVVGALVIGGQVSKDSDTSFGGSDSAATAAIADTGYEPWWQPITTLAPEVESGLFALQAAIGAGLLGYFLGTLRERRRHPVADPTDGERADGTTSA
ncbi:MAG: energy-coupling factor ABC transporter substrate-binding protein [Ornithinimicrobium sp.]